MCFFLIPCVGNPTIPQGQRPSFMDYFDKQDSNKAQESYNHNQQDPYHMPKTAFPDNWKVPQDGDFDFVSRSQVTMGVWSRFVVLYFIVVLYFVACCVLIDWKNEYIWLQVVLFEDEIGFCFRF